MAALRLGIVYPVLVDTFKASIYKGWNFNSGNYLFTTDKK